jgi:CheY-like chemotaxis protein
MNVKPMILVVDDDGPILLLMRNLLREFGFETVAASSGRQAVDAARTRVPDLVLVDKNMPGMSGAEVIRILRGDLGLASLPILILSGEPVDPTELSTLGATAAVQKPFDVPALIQQIRSHLS